MLTLTVDIIAGDKPRSEALLSVNIRQVDAFRIATMAHWHLDGKEGGGGVAWLW